MARVPVGLTIGNSKDVEVFALRDDYVRARPESRRTRRRWPRITSTGSTPSS
jgi:hypothetical protein